MPSRQIQRLRSMHKDLQALYNGYTGAAGTHRKAIRELGAMNAVSSVTALGRQHSNATSKLAALRQEADTAIEAIKKRATRQKAQPTEATKNDIDRMFSRGADIRSICQWVLATGRPDGFAALREIVSQIAYADRSKAEEMLNVPTSERTPEKWIQAQEQVIVAHELQTMDATQRAAQDELREVENCQQWLYRDLANLDSFLADQADPNGGLRQLTSFSKWPGIPGQHEGNSAELLADGIDVPLANNAVS